MTARAFLLRSLEHTQWGNRRVLEALRGSASPPPQAARRLARLLAAEQVWMLRLRGEDARTTPIWPEDDLDACEEHLRLNGQAYRAFLDTLPDTWLGEVVTSPNSSGQVFQTPVGDILQHVFAHGAYHRGQIALLMRQAGLTPVNTDFITFARETGPG